MQLKRPPAFGGVLTPDCILTASPLFGFRMLSSMRLPFFFYFFTYSLIVVIIGNDNNTDTLSARY